MADGRTDVETLDRFDIPDTGIVTQLLEAAHAQLAKLPPDEQDRVGHWLLEELQDEQRWDRQFSASQDVLSKPAKPKR